VLSILVATYENGSRCFPSSRMTVRRRRSFSPGVSYGDVMKVRVENLPAITLVGLVKLGDVKLATRAKTSTDENRSLDAEVLGSRT
jgi:hypothetical protein